MPSSPKNYPFYNWVPKPVGIIILFVFFLPILTVGGTYSVASTEMMSELGIISEHIQFANFATSIGMAAFCPFLYRLVVIRRQKMMCLAGFSLMYIFSYICAKTDSVFLLALCSIFMGFLRMVLMMVNLFTLIKYAGHIEAYDKITPGNEPTTDEGWDKLDIERSAAQPAIYLFFMVLGQLGTSLTAWLAFEYEWQYIHYFMMGLLLLCILITFITMPYHKYTTRRFPINFKQFGNASIFCITLACITYVLTYGKVLDWYDDPTIQWATVCAIIAGGIFLYIESTQRNPYYQLDVFKLRTIRMGFLFYFLLMVLMMVNLFTLIKYAGHIEAYDKITPGNEPVTGEGWDKLDIERSAAQPAIYLFFMVLGQLGTSLTAWLAFEYEWQYIHYFMMGLLLLCILITFITMPYHKYTTRRFPINLKQFGNASIFCITLACITYVLTYGKVLDWYDDPTIRWATVCAIIAGGIFLYIESTQRNPYYQLDVFKLRTIRMGFLFYFLLMVLNSSAMFVNVFTGIGMKLDNFQNATLGNWSMLGYLIGGIATIWLSVKGVHFKYLFAAGFLLLGLSAMFMYFEVQGAGLYERMKYPVIIRSTGMMFLYSLIPTYATQRMPYKYLSSWICTMITVRMVLAPCIGAALYTNVLQERQQHYVTRYAQNVDMLHPEASASFTQTVQGMQYQGKSKQEAINMAAISTKGRIQVQATLSAVKEMAGWTLYACLFCMIFVLVVRYPKRKLLT